MHGWCESILKGQSKIPYQLIFQTMQMIVGLIVLVLLAVGVWWYMGNGASAPAEPTTDAAQEAAMEETQ